jgi:hypothetical protein
VFKNLFSVAVILIGLGFSCDLAASNNANLRVVHQGNITKYINTQDFASNVGTKSRYLYLTKKSALTEKLAALTSGSDADVSSQVEAFDLLEQTQTLSNQEKTDWIKAHVQQLVPPFYVLNAVFLASSDPDAAGAWYQFGRISMYRDMEKCTDRSVSAAFSIIFSHYLGPKLFAKMGLMDKQKDKNQIKKTFTDWTDRTYKQAMDLYRAYPVKRLHPYWIANHGMSQFIEGSNKQGPFFDQNTWSAKEKDLLEYNHRLWQKRHQKKQLMKKRLAV